MSILEKLDYQYKVKRNYELNLEEMKEIFGEDFKTKMVLYEETRRNKSFLLLFFEEGKWYECYIYKIENELYYLNADLMNTTFVSELDEKTREYLKNKKEAYKNSLQLIDYI